MSQEDISARRGLTFAQAEGIEPLPKQLEKKAMPNRLRSRLWDEISSLLDDVSVDNGYQVEVLDNWYKPIRDYYVDKTNLFGDQFYKDASDVKDFVRGIISAGVYYEVYNIIQSILGVSDNIYGIADRLNNVFESELCPYRVYDHDIIAALCSEAEGHTIKSALDETSKVGAQGPRAHIRNAIQSLNKSDFGGSVRESIGAVESISKLLASNPKATLGSALSSISKNSNIHTGMREALESYMDTQVMRKE